MNTQISLSSTSRIIEMFMKLKTRNFALNPWYIEIITSVFLSKDINEPKTGILLILKPILDTAAQIGEQIKDEYVLDLNVYIEGVKNYYKIQNPDDKLFQPINTCKFQTMYIFYES